jgi:hypothetical protein
VCKIFGEKIAVIFLEKKIFGFLNSNTFLVGKFFFNKNEKFFHQKIYLILTNFALILTN